MITIFVERSLSGFHIKLQSDDQGAFRLAIETLKSFVRADYRSYHPPTKKWSVDEGAANSLFRWLDHLRAYLSGVQVEWQYPEEESREWRPPPRPKAQAEDPYATLHLLPTAPVEVVRAAFRALAGLHHPDRGGDGEHMRRVNAAYEALEQRLKAA